MPILGILVEVVKSWKIWKLKLVSKCVSDGIRSLDFGEDPKSIDIFAMVSSEGERILLGKNLKARGNVENWLTAVEQNMVSSLRRFSYYTWMCIKIRNPFGTKLWSQVETTTHPFATHSINQFLYLLKFVVYLLLMWLTRPIWKIHEDNSCVQWPWICTLSSMGGMYAYMQ